MKGFAWPASFIPSRFNSMKMNADTQMMEIINYPYYRLYTKSTDSKEPVFGLNKLKINLWKNSGLNIWQKPFSIYQWKISEKLLRITKKWFSYWQCSLQIHVSVKNSVLNLSRFQKIIFFFVQIVGDNPWCSIIVFCPAEFHFLLFQHSIIS